MKPGRQGQEWRVGRRRRQTAALGQWPRRPRLRFLGWRCSAETTGGRKEGYFADRQHRVAVLRVMLDVGTGITP